MNPLANNRRLYLSVVWSGITALLLCYAAAMWVSASKLQSWYAQYAGGLEVPTPWGALPLSWGLALAIELFVFVASLISTALKGLLSPWAYIGGLAGLAVVYVGNLVAMHASAPLEARGLAWLAASFVALTSLASGKVVGELLLLTQYTSTPPSAPTPLQTDVPPLHNTLQVGVVVNPPATTPPMHTTPPTPHNEVTPPSTQPELPPLVHPPLQSAGAPVHPPALDAAFAWIQQQEGGVQARALADALGVSEDTAKRRLRQLRDIGLATWNGRAWVLLRGDHA